MPPTTHPQAAAPVDGLPGRVRRMKLLAALIALALAVAGFFLVRSGSQKAYRLRMTAGDSLGHRHALATILAGEAKVRRLTLEITPTSGSSEALSQVASGRLDVALVQGGLDSHAEIRQVAVLIPEPLHVLVRPDLLERGVAGLRGKRLDLGPAGSGTRRLAQQTLTLAGLKPDEYRDTSESYTELRNMAAADLPDAVFHVSSLPAPFAEWIVAERGYRLLPVPFGDAMALRDRSLQDVTIPAYTYGVDPPVPAQPVSTVAPWLSIVARRDVPDEAVIRLLESVFDGDFALHAELQGLEVEQVVKRREFALHSGTTTFLNRNHPLITGEFIEGVENLRSFLVSALVALFLAWRWFRSRASVGFERYFDEVTRIELEILETGGAGRLAAEQVQQIEQRLTRVKSEAIEQFSSGRLRGGDLLGSFLSHVVDVRNCLHAHRNER
ncbi:MAG: TAXI family TRAP transporter solute-binding subunit [Planctomycetia bacterium]|nr:TAXI family TRAP transporter solute-binding subunit [Planctomycetia bacterium]